CCAEVQILEWYFFFQAEDGIRDFHVTGVQTCALPISMFMVDIAVPRDIEPDVATLEDVYLYGIDDLQQVIDDNRRSRAAAARERSEERRGGKESATRGAPYSADKSGSPLAGARYRVGT